MPRNCFYCICTVEVLDEIADNKDTILHVISDLYVNYVCKHDKKYLVIEGDAKTYDTIQSSLSMGQI